jgi:hypothetical protein
MKLLELRITLLEVQPLVWRSVLVSPDLALDRMHRLLQTVMGWEDAHLHRFCAGSSIYSDPQVGLDGRARDERKVRLGDLLSIPGSQLSYEYDFGDGWEHEIHRVGQVDSDVNATYALCTAGARACPPEDCGGPPGYADLLRALKGDRGRRYEELRAWVGGRFDPARFSTDDVNARIARLFLPGHNGQGRGN